MHTELIKQLIKKAIAEEVAAFYAYYIPVEFLQGKEFTAISNLSREFAMDELHDHAEKLLKRLAELDGTVAGMMDLQSLLANSETPQPFAEADTADFIRTNIEAERNAILTYQELILIAKAEGDTTTEDLARHILADEEEHLSKLNDFLPCFLNNTAEQQQEAKVAASPDKESAQEMEKAQKGTSQYDEWLRKFKEKRDSYSKESKEKLTKIREILENGSSFEEEVNGKKLKITDDTENYTISYDGKVDKFDSSLGVLTRRAEDKILSILEPK